MVANTQVLENILTQVKQLSPEYRLRLVQNILQTLMSTFEDFIIAEWRPTDEQ